MKQSLKETKEYLKVNKIVAASISFYVSEDSENEGESFFGLCELSGMKGDVVSCRALDTEGNLVRFNAGTWLVHGALGKLAGAF